MGFRVTPRDCFNMQGYGARPLCLAVSVVLKSHRGTWLFLKFKMFMYRMKLNFTKAKKWA